MPSPCQRGGHWDRAWACTGPGLCCFRGKPGGDPILWSDAWNLLELGEGGSLLQRGQQWAGCGMGRGALIALQGSHTAGTVTQSEPGYGYRTVETAPCPQLNPKPSLAKAPFPTASHAEPASSAGQSCDQGHGPGQPGWAVGSAALQDPSPWLQPTHSSAQTEALFGRQGMASTQDTRLAQWSRHVFGPGRGAECFPTLQPLRSPGRGVGTGFVQEKLRPGEEGGQGVRTAAIRCPTVARE